MTSKGLKLRKGQEVHLCHEAGNNSGISARKFLSSPSGSFRWSFVITVLPTVSSSVYRFGIFQPTILKLSTLTYLTSVVGNNQLKFMPSLPLLIGTNVVIDVVLSFHCYFFCSFRCFQVSRLPSLP